MDEYEKYAYSRIVKFCQSEIEYLKTINPLWETGIGSAKGRIESYEKIIERIEKHGHS